MFSQNQLSKDNIKVYFNIMPKSVYTRTTREVLCTFTFLDKHCRNEYHLISFNIFAQRVPNEGSRAACNNTINIINQSYQLNFALHLPYVLSIIHCKNAANLVFTEGYPKAQPLPYEIIPTI